MSKIIVLIGIPCSGKTTFAKEWVNAKQGRIRVNNETCAAYMASGIVLIGDTVKVIDTIKPIYNFKAKGR